MLPVQMFLLQNYDRPITIPISGVSRYTMMKSINPIKCDTFWNTYINFAFHFKAADAVAKKKNGDE